MEEVVRVHQYWDIACCDISHCGENFILAGNGGFIAECL